MNKQQQRKLKKHPLIRLMRGIVRLIRVIFRPARSNARLSPTELAQIERIELERAQIELAQIKHNQILAEESRELAERYLTVGELFDRVQWQFSPPKDLGTDVSTTKIKSLTHDVSLN
jgi:hypothetical protein